MAEEENKEKGKKGKGEKGKGTGTKPIVIAMWDALLGLHETNESAPLELSLPPHSQKGNFPSSPSPAHEVPYTNNADPADTHPSDFMCLYSESG